MCVCGGGEISKMPTMHHDGRMLGDMIINLTTLLLIPCFVATETDFKWLENMVLFLMQLFLLTTRALGELY